jgi:hypothetical protein
VASFQEACSRYYTILLQRCSLQIMDHFLAALCVFVCLIGGAAEKVRSHVRKRRRKRTEVEGVVRAAHGKEEGWTEIAGTVEARRSKNGSSTSYEVSLWHRPLDDRSND